jgi:hypothetical protein
LDACFVVTDSAGQKLAYVYFENEPGRRSAAKLLERDEARRIAVNISGALSRCSHGLHWEKAAPVAAVLNSLLWVYSDPQAAWGLSVGKICMEPGCTETAVLQLPGHSDREYLCAQHARRSVAINVRLRPSTKQLAERCAREEGRSLTNYLENLILADAKRNRR